MSVERIMPAQAHERITEGWKYVDVRSVPEFDDGHPEGAYNVPFMHRSDRGLVANPDFLRVMSACFAADERIVLGCKSGGRSLQAARVLVSAGFTQVVDMRGGFVAEVGPGGQVTCAGWQSCDLPVARKAEPGRSYDELSSAG